MSYSTDPVEDAHRHDVAQEEAAKLWDTSAVERALAGEFLRLAEKGDANALAFFAPRVVDADAVRTLGLRWTDKNLPTRFQTLAEVMYSQLDSPRQTFATEVMQLVLNASRCTDVDLALQASALMERMAAHFSQDVVQS